VALAAGGAQAWREKERTRLEYERAQHNLEFAYRILDEIYVDQAERRLSGEAALTPEERTFLERALGFYEQIAAQNPDGPDGRRRTALAGRRVGEIQFRLGQPQKAEAAYVRAIALLESEAADVRLELARCHNNLGLSLRSRHQWERAEAALRRAL